jgi:hypothetical protein
MGIQTLQHPIKPRRGLGVHAYHHPIPRAHPQRCLRQTTMPMISTKVACWRPSRTLSARAWPSPDSAASAPGLSSLLQINRLLCGPLRLASMIGWLCWARVSNGNATAALPTRPMNSRRRMFASGLRTKHRIGANECCDRCYGGRRGYFIHRRRCEPMERPMIAVIEMSLSSWLVAGIVRGVERPPLKKLAVDESALLKLLHRWRLVPRMAPCRGCRRYAL